MKAFIFILLFLFTNFGLKAQLYIKPILGYCYDVFKNYKGGGIYYDISIANDTSAKAIANNPKIGNGVKFGSSVGFLIFKNINFEFGLYYFRGFNTKISQYERIDTAYYLYYDMNNIRTTLANPSFCYNSEINNKLSSYLKFGFLIGIGRLNKFMYYNDTKYNTEHKYYHVNYGNYFIGFNTGVGFQYNLNNKTAIFSEIELNSLSYTPLYYYVSKTINNGVVYDRVLSTQEYVNEASYSGKNYNNKLLKRTIKFNNISFNVGVKYNLQEADATNKKFTIELTSGFSLLYLNFDYRFWLYKYSFFKLTPTLDLNILYCFNKSYIGLGTKSFFNTRNYKNDEPSLYVAKLNAIHTAYLQYEYDIIKHDKFAFAPNIRFGTFDIISNSGSFNKSKYKIYSELGLCNKIKLNKKDLIIKPNFAYMTLSDYENKLKGLTYFLSFALNVGLRF